MIAIPINIRLKDATISIKVIEPLLCHSGNTPGRDPRCTKRDILPPLLVGKDRASVHRSFNQRVGTFAGYSAASFGFVLKKGTA